jgi:MFS family permease
LLGIGTAFAYTPLISLIGTWFPARRGLVIGLLNSGVGTGMMSAGWIVPYLAQLDVDHGWRWVWILFAGVAIGALLASLAFVRDPPRPARSPRALTTAERRSARMAVFRNPYVVIVGIIYGIVGMTYIVQAIFMYSYALAANIDPDVAGALAAFMGMLGIVFGPVWGSLSDQLGRGQSLTLSMLMAFVSTLVPVLSPTLYGFATHYLILGVAVTGMFTSSLAASTERVNVDQAPLAVSYVTMFFAAGQLVGPSAAGWLIGVTDAFRFTFGVSAGLILLGALLSFQLTRLPRSV